MRVPSIPTPFNAGDDGSANPALLEVLARSDAAAVIEGLREQRLFVGVVALLADDSGAEKESEMALALLEHGGAQVLPVFTSIASLQSWRADARPVAVIAEAAGLQVLADGMAGMLVDAVDSHVQLLTTREVRALVLGYPLVAVHQDPQVISVLEAAVANEPLAATAWMGPGESVDAVITVLIPDLDADTARPIAERIAETVVADEQVRLRLERGLDVQVVAARPQV